MRRVLLLMIVCLFTGSILAQEAIPVPPRAGNGVVRADRALAASQPARTTAEPEVWVDDDFTAADAGWGVTKFATLTTALAGVNAGGVVNVAAGTYAENIIITSPVTILGPNASVNPNTGSRVAEAVLMTALPGAYQNSGDPFETIIEIKVSAVTIKGLSFNGNNPALTSGVLSNGEDIDAASAILSDDGAGSIVIENNIITGFSYSALEFYNYVNSGGVTTNNYFRNNKFDNIMPASWGIGILVYNNFYAEITGNVMTRTRVGIQTGNFYTANTGATQSISNNSIETNRLGIFFNLMYSGCSTFDVANNTITAVPGWPTSRGMLISSIQSAVAVNLTNNTITGMGIGVNLWNDPTSNTVTITGGTISGCNFGVRIDNYDGYGPSNGASTVGALNGVTIMNSGTAALLIRDNRLNSNGATVAGNILAGTIFTGNPVDVMLDGIDVSYTSAVPGVVVGYANIVTVSDPAGSHATIQAAIDAANPGATVTAAKGIYNEDVNVTKQLTLRGAGIDQSTIVGLKTTSVSTLNLGTNNAVVEGFTVTRDGNNVTDWTLIPSSKGGVNFGQGTTGNVLQKCKVTGNRNGVYFNNSQGNIVRENVITFNRTGIQLVNNVSNTVIQNNEITNNWTVGFVLYYGSAGQPATTNLLVTRNTISGNWYSEVDCKTVQANPTAVYDFSGNWLGSNVLNVTSSPAGEPGYDGQIPVAYGGTATNPGTGTGRISGDAVSLIDYSPWLETGVDLDPALMGFQPDLSEVRVSAASPQSGSVTRIQEGVDLVTGSTVRIAAGTYTEAVNIAKANLVLLGDVSNPANVIINAGGLGGYGSPLSGIYANVSGVQLKGFTLVGGGKAITSNPRYGINISGVSNCVVQHVVVKEFNRTGVNVPGCSNMTFDHITAIDNGGNGIGLRDVSNSTISNITTANNAWGGLRVQSYYGPISGVVISGTNAFGEDGSAPLYLHPFFLEQGNVDPAGPPFPISYGHTGTPDVLFPLADFGYALSGNDDEAPQYQRIHFYKTKAQAQTAAAAPIGTYAYHITTNRYVRDLATGHYIVESPLTIGGAVFGATDGAIIDVAAGTYVEGPQVVVDKNLSIVGADKNTVIITPSANTGSTGDARGWFLVHAGNTFNMSGVTLNGTGKDIMQGVRNLGTGTIDDVHFTGIQYPGYNGLAAVGFGNLAVTNCSFTNIGRVGVIFFGTGVTNGVVRNITYTGKGTGDWLDYAVEFGGGAKGVIEQSTITECRGVASSDGSTSGGILASTYYGAGTQITATDNTVTNCTAGFAIGYNASDATVAVLTGNDLTGCTYGVESTAPVVDARHNWWGDGSGPAGGVADPTTAVVANGTGAQVSEHVRFDPWTGKTEQVIVPAPGTYTWPLSGVAMTFGTVPPDGGNVTVQRFPGTPPNPPYPAPPAGATYIPLWLMLSSTMPNYSFSVTVTVDVSDIAGFGPASQIMYLNSVTNTWVPVGGTYNDVAKTFTFTTTHFTPYAFVNTPATAFDLYLSSTPSATVSGIYPNNTWAMPSPLPAGYPNPPRATNDWGYTATQTFDVYIVPEAGMAFGAADLTLEWDPAIIDFATVSFTGSVFGAGNILYATFDTLGASNRVRINASLTSPNNVTAVAGNFIAKVTFRTVKPGHTAITMIAADLRQYAGAGAPLGLYVTPHQADVRGYLGDVANGVDETSADGAINFSDLNPWATAYWSGVPGYTAGMTHYKAKFDIGPTADGYVFSAPQVDGKIDFEDLIIFSISYGLSANHQLPKRAVEQAEPVTVAVGAIAAGGSETRVPVMIEGGVMDLRGLSLTFSGAHGRLLGVEPGALLGGYETPVPVMVSERDGRVYVDMAIAGASVDALNAAGEVLVLRFEGKATVDVTAAEARTSMNTALATKIRASAQTEVPTEFALQQNYPNPFNPSTTVSYALPAVSDVRIAVYNVLGEEVTSLVNGIQEAGFHTVEWNGRDASGMQVTSGVYFLSMRAGEFTAMRKMMLVK